MNPRLAAARALSVVLSGKASLGSSLPEVLGKVDARDRGLTQELAFGTARWQPRLAGLANKLLQKPFKAADKDVEFDAWRWGDLSGACDLIVPFKRPAYEQVVAAFSHLAA